jgi:hypothetical protein
MHVMSYVQGTSNTRPAPCNASATEASGNAPRKALWAA